MGMYIRQDDKRTELQERIAAGLQDKAKRKAKIDDDTPDGVDDSAYIEGTKQTTSLAWVWVLIVVAIIAAAVYFMIQTSL